MQADARIGPTARRRSAQAAKIVSSRANVQKPARSDVASGRSIAFIVASTVAYPEQGLEAAQEPGEQRRGPRTPRPQAATIRITVATIPRASCR
jgi:hypothetical protein